MSAKIVFPLPPGHVFGPRGGDLRYHSGFDSLTDFRALQTWQAAYRDRLLHLYKPTGRFDGPMQRAVIDVQRLSGLPVDGRVDADTWTAVWTAQRPVKVMPKVEPDKTRLKHTPQNRRTWHYWRQVSQRDIGYGTDPTAPPWYPGRPFGAKEGGAHVRELQELLGLKPTGCMNEATTRKVRGLQRLHGLPVSGIVDARVAALVDPPPWPVHEPLQSDVSAGSSKPTDTPGPGEVS